MKKLIMDSKNIKKIECEMKNMDCEFYEYVPKGTFVLSKLSIMD